MEKRIAERIISRVMAALFLLIFVSALTFSIIGITFASEAHSSEHILSYDTNSLTWNDGATGIGEDGSYSIDLFNTLPVGEDGMKIIAPGAKDGGSFSLINKTSRPLEYTAAIFIITDSGVPIIADFPSFDPSNTVEDYALPQDLADAKVLRVVSGELGSYKSCEFIVEWEWAFTVGDEQDMIDTGIGNLELSELSIGVMVTVSDPMAQDGVIAPDPSTCNCMVCLFGGGCAMCWLCWTMTAIVIFVGGLCVISIVLSLVYGLWWIAMIAVSLLCVIGFAILLIMLLV